MTEPLGDENLDGLAHQVVAAAEEEPLGGAIDEHDRAVLTGDDHGVGGGFEQFAELLLGLHPVGDVLTGALHADHVVFVVDDQPARARSQLTRPSDSGTR